MLEHIKRRIRAKKSRGYLAYAIVFTVICLFSGIFADLRRTRMIFIPLGILFMPFTIGYLCFLDMFRVQFGDTKLERCWRKLVYSRIPYDKIGSIAIIGVQDNFVPQPQLDERGKHEAFVLLHRNNDEFIRKMTPSESRKLSYGRGGSVLGSMNYRKDYIQGLMAHTACKLYITSEMFHINKKDLMAVLPEYSDRVFVCCAQPGSDGHFVPYERFVSEYMD